MVAIGLLLQSSCIAFSQKETFFEVFPDAVTVHATRALFWPDIPRVLFWEDKHLVQAPLKEGARLLQQLGKSLTLQLEVCWSGKKKETPINRTRDVKLMNYLEVSPGYVLQLT